MKIAMFKFQLRISDQITLPPSKLSWMILVKWFKKNKEKSLSIQFKSKMSSIVSAATSAYHLRHHVLVVMAKIVSIWKGKSLRNKRRVEIWNVTGLCFLAKSCTVIKIRATLNIRKWSLSQESSSKMSQMRWMIIMCLCSHSC